MAKRSHAPDALEEFEGAADRLAQWIGEHAWQVGGSVLLVLALAGAWGGYHSYTRSREEAASTALADARSSYLLALGAQPGALVVPELANPKAAEAIREQYLERFRAVAAEHPKTVGGTLALLEATEILDALGRPQDTEETWRQALASASGNPSLRGLIQQRIAEQLESREAWAEAAAAHEAAGEIASFPLRYLALADAARCYAAAGQPDRALELYERVEREAPDVTLPPHMRAQLRELRAAAAEPSP